VDFSNGELGVPLLKGCVCNIECRLKESYDGGDHTIFIGEVDQTTVADGDPLLYFRSNYLMVGERSE
jgi:flavin reductase (DIM6/NTAB) family NADH-FMN oxidoreductase RutF